MKILIDINHPADVHQFKFFIKKLQKEGHVFKIVARDKDHTFELLKQNGFDYVERPGYKGIKKFFGILRIDSQLLRISRSFKPDILIGSSGDCYISQTGFLLRKPSLIFDDTEFSRIQNWLTFPFATKIITPACYWLNLGNKQVRYNGYKELAYLHPKYFKPDQDIVRKSGIDPSKKYVIIRLVSWEASHDINGKGMKNIGEIIKKIGKYADVHISSEKELPPELNKYRINISFNEIHHILSYATLLLGESATMASECAVLGTPAIFISNSQRGYTKEQEEKYGLVFHFEKESDAIEKAHSLLVKDNLKKEWQKKRDRMLSEKIDVTDWMVKYLEGFGI